MSEESGQTTAPSENQEDWRLEFRSFRVDLALYGRDALFRACYQFTDRCYLFLHTDTEASVTVEFRRRVAKTNLDDVVGGFANELLSQRLRLDIARETQGIREMIVTRAFADARFDAQPNRSDA